MTFQDFAYFLQGFTEITNSDQPPTKEQWQIIKDHLQLCFTKITPNYNKPNFTGPEPTYCSALGSGVQTFPLIGDSSLGKFNFGYSELIDIRNVYNESGYPMSGSPAYNLYFKSDGIQFKFDHAFTC